MKLKIETNFDKRTQKSMSTWIQMIKAFNAIRAEELRLITRCNLTINQFSVLEALYHRGDLTVGEITVLIDSTPGNVTVVIKNLQKNGMAVVKQALHDSRMRVVSITKDGKKLIGSMFGEHAANLCSCFSPLSDEELQTLFECLRKLRKRRKNGKKN
ncbi:MAG: MarR family winged helix-turn-helix transcriptional regulator [Campylobacteraceae bacterium]|nr:MarR family winged helix-turn-helix transcriptional regulator [Campylobacteraceae bacterium]